MTHPFQEGLSVKGHPLPTTSPYSLIRLETTCSSGRYQPPFCLPIEPFRQHFQHLLLTCFFSAQAKLLWDIQVNRYSRTSELTSLTTMNARKCPPHQHIMYRIDPSRLIDCSAVTRSKKGVQAGVALPGDQNSIAPCSLSDWVFMIPRTSRLQDIGLNILEICCVKRFAKSPHAPQTALLLCLYDPT